MISEQYVETLKRLTRGKFKLSEDQMLGLIEEVKGADAPDILCAVFPPKAKRVKKPVPEWLKEMDEARKRLSWKASDAVAKIYELASLSAVELNGAHKKSFPAAARHLASSIGEEAAKTMFVDWVDQFAENHRMV